MHHSLSALSRDNIAMFCPLVAALRTCRQVGNENASERTRARVRASERV